RKRDLARLQLGDNLSLYICLNKPGVEKEKEHPFFKDGIPISPLIPTVNHKHIHGYWIDKDTVTFEHLPDITPFSITLVKKELEVSKIASSGLLQAYKNTEPHRHVIHIR